VYTLSEDGFDRTVSGATLLNGVPVTLTSDQPATLRVCRG
jgi:hypothetical protein